ncbi:PIF1-like helicase domain-containing protein [Hirsutella rhossiliensis]|uniref:ATP-dependent DNA helicase n=1 Tax=Hirsutella rhossiliensis TaxID=111463 RepID=A0A9P8MKR2_9HYPO|nr:PIF1-like helicase domain-containing protein [Hirsutella rhossiliensis]KAH0957122.1 PIF1-like helicase domain-containing protein [Hirsutella rhossiliensis]
MEDQRRPSHAAGYPASADTKRGGNLAAADTEGGRALAAARRAQRRLGLREKPARTKRNPASADSRGRRSFAAADEKFGRSAGHSATADMEGRRPFAADEKFGRAAGYLGSVDTDGARTEGNPASADGGGRRASPPPTRSSDVPRDIRPQPTWRAAGPSPPSSGTSSAVVSIGSQHSPRAIQSRPASRAEIPATTPAAAGLLAEDLASALRHLDEEFEAGERLANEQTWCAPVPRERQVRTVRKFYRAFHDAGTLPIATCTLCYRKRAKGELREMAWEGWEGWSRSGVAGGGRSPFGCQACFPEGRPVAVCAECARWAGREGASPAMHLHGRLGCEHAYPDELKDLTPLEEKLISLNSCYGFVTKYSIPGGQRQSVRYPRHVKGHITVFPNDVQGLAAKVLPHPLVRVMDEIHVSWQGAERPGPRDLSGLLSENNPLYGEVEIDAAEIASWGAPPHGVPPVVCERLERNEPSARERTQTAQVVPPSERAMDDGGAAEIEEVLAMLRQGQDPAEGSRDVGLTCEDDDRDGARPEEDGDVINEVTSSGMFPLDGAPDVADAEKIRFARDAVGPEGARASPRTWVGTAARGRRATAATASRTYRCDAARISPTRRTPPSAKAFRPCSLGLGGPRLADEDAAGERGPSVGNQGAQAERVAEGLMSTRNMKLQAWADVVLRRHGGRFATHPIFAFLVFNMGVRSKNRQASMLGVARKNFARVEGLLKSLTAQRLEAARPSSRPQYAEEDTILIVRYGVPAIWFTLNPNDITNLVKLRLAAHRGRDPDEAEAFLSDLGTAYKRTRLAISDPMSSAVFFHREMTLFFEHYVNVGEESVFGHVGAYYGAVETNERGALHIHGLLWLRGNAGIGDALAGPDAEEQAAYRERIVRYVDSVFSEELDAEGYCAMQAERSATADISSRLDDVARFTDTFDEEANFCAGATQIHTHSATCGNKTRTFLLKAANRVFTERPLSQVEVIAHLLGYPAEFSSGSAWAYINANQLYWAVFRRWRHLRRASGAEATGDAPDETALRRPGCGATVCVDGYLSKEFSEEDDESCHRRAAVQHLALFVPWESFLGEEAGDINNIWARARMAATAEEGGMTAPQADDEGRGAAEGGEEAYRAGGAGDAARLIDVVRTPPARDKSRRIGARVGGRARGDGGGGREGRQAGEPTGLGAVGAALPRQEEVRAIKSQQRSAARERERAIQGIQGGGAAAGVGADRGAALRGVMGGFGEDDIDVTAADGDADAGTAAGMRELAGQLTLNEKQAIALLIVCRQLDRIRQGDDAGGDGGGQLCLFIGGEGGTGKSRVIEALVELLARRDLSSRLLVTATSGTAAARINGITLHSACGLTGERFVDGRSRMDWQEKEVLVIDEVSMLGARTLHAANEQLCRLRGSARDFGGIPVVILCGDFHQFRPVQERSILLPSAAVAWDEDGAFAAEQRRQHDKAHALWRRFTTVVMLDEQMRAAGDPELRRLLGRIRRGEQDRSDLELLNSRCYRPGRRIPWETGLTVVTPLNRNRWNLNLEAALAFRERRRTAARVFSEHKWRDGVPTEEEAVLMLGQGDDSATPVPAVFLFVPGMPVVVNQNTHQGLSNGAGVKITAQRKRPWQRNDVSRRGLPCAAAFACTDYKVQGGTLERVALELRGARMTTVEGRAVPSSCDPYSLYVQLSRCPTLDGIMLVSEVRSGT